MRLLVALLSTPLPWRLRRLILARLSGYDLHPQSKIGLSIVVPKKGLVLEQGASIGHLNVIWNLDRLHMGKEAKIAHLNWISAIRVGDDPVFDEYPDRRPELLMDECAGITMRHYIDCSDQVHLEKFALIAGLRSTFMAHHMNVQRGRQSCGPIRVGCYSFVSTNCVMLGGASLPHHSVLGARSLLLKDPEEPFRLYAGTPASILKKYPPDLPWFQRTSIRTY